jgi:hypothetical protein
MGFVKRLFHREAPPEASCPHCGVPMPEGSVECTACGWDLRDAADRPEPSAAAVPRSDE